MKKLLAALLLTLVTAVLVLFATACFEGVEPNDYNSNENGGITPNGGTNQGGDTDLGEGTTPGGTTTDEDENASKGLTYELSSDGTYYAVTGIGSCTDTDIVIPSKYKGLPVIIIGEEAFAACKNLKSIIIGNNVTSIGMAAFCYCESLTSITIPNGVTRIGDSAFYNCLNLENVNMSDNIHHIGNGVFENCYGVKYNEYGNAYYLGNEVNPFLVLIKAKDTSITSLTIHENTVYIHSDAFENCQSLEYNQYDIGHYLGNETNPFLVLVSVSYIGPFSGITTVNIHNDTKFIHSNTFCDCTFLKSITIPEGVTSIGDFAFYRCSSLTNVTIPDSVTIMGDYAFAWCESLAGITIPNGVSFVGNCAFSGCANLVSVVTGDGVTYIGYLAFSDCSSLESVTIGRSVNSIDYNVFYNCTSLINIEANPNNGSYTSINGNLYSKNVKVLIQYAVGKKDISFTIPDSVNYIESMAFSNCDNLTSIEVSPYNISYKSINGNLYSKDGATLVQYAKGKKDTSFTIPDSVTSIGELAFYNCANLMSVTISDDVITIGSSAFCNCTSLTSVTIGNDVTTIDDYAFSGCANLTTVTIPDSVTSIGNNAFRDCTNLVNVAIGNGVTTIGSFAFDSCTSLTSIIIPDGVKTIDTCTFQGCTGLTSVSIPESVTSIGDYAFRNCISLTSVTIPESVTSIDFFAFEGCDKLLEVYNLSSLDITKGSDSYGYVGYYALNVYASKNERSKFHTTSDGFVFYEDGEVCYLLGYNGTETDIILPESCNGKNYKIYKNAFYYRKDLTSVAIPDCVTAIGDYAFYNCTNLASIVIGNSVISIGDYTFWNCTSLATVIIPASLTSFGRDAFYYCTNYTIKYGGTQEQWTAISKGSTFVFTGNYTITYNYTGD